MTIPDPRLLVPLTVLPSVPVGAPVVVPFDPDNPEPGIIVDADTGSGRLLYTAALHTTGSGTRLTRIYDPEKVAFDLSPPDPPGSRVDALDEALRWLGWSPLFGGRGSGDIEWFSRKEDGISFGLRIGRRLHLWQDCPGEGVTVVLPALASIDVLDPLALRLAVAEILRSVGAP